MRGTNANTDAHSYTDSYANPNSDSNPDPDTNSRRRWIGSAQSGVWRWR